MIATERVELFPSYGVLIIVIVTAYFCLFHVYASTCFKLYLIPGGHPIMDGCTLYGWDGTPGMDISAICMKVCNNLLYAG